MLLWQHICRFTILLVKMVMWSSTRRSCQRSFPFPSATNRLQMCRFPRTWCWPLLKIRFSFSWFPLPQPALRAAYSTYPGSNVPWDARHTSKKKRLHCLWHSLVPNQMIRLFCLLFNLPQYLQFASPLLPSKLPGKVRSQRGRLLCTEHNPEGVKFPVLQ